MARRKSRRAQVPSEASERRPHDARKPPPPPREAALIGRFDRWVAHGPRPLVLVPVLVAAVLALYLPGFGYPAVFAELAALSPERLARAGAALVGLEPGSLGQATLAITARVAASLHMHRVLQAGLHALTVALLFAVLLRMLAARVPVSSPEGALAPAWTAFFAAALFAVAPASVYAVAYLAARPEVLAVTLAMASLAAWLKGLDQGRRVWLVVAAVLSALAVLASQALAALPLVSMLLLVHAGRADARVRRVAWTLVALAALASFAMVAGSSLAPEAGGDAPAASASALTHALTVSWRMVGYLAAWNVPFTPAMAIDIPEPALAGAWGWLAAGALGFALLAVFGGRLLARTSIAAVAGFALLVPVVLALPEAAVARLAEPFSLARGYAWMPFALVPLVVLAARLPGRAAWPLLFFAVLGCAVLAALRLPTFSTHAGVWNEAIARAERFGAPDDLLRLLINRAAVHRRDGHVFAAIEDYDRALALAPDNTRVLRARVQAYLDARRFDDALADLERLRGLGVAAAQIAADRGTVLLEAGRALEALSEFDQAVAGGVTEARVLMNRGLTRLRLGGMQAAEAALTDIDAAIARDPRYAPAHHRRGALFEEAARAGLRLRDAQGPILLRTIAAQNYGRACELGHADGCRDARRIVGSPDVVEPVRPQAPAQPPGRAAPTQR